MAAKTIVDFANLIKDYTKKLVHWGDQSKGYVGKNHLKVENTTTTISNVSFTVNSDKSITVNGTNNSGSTITFNLMVDTLYFNDFKGKSFYLSGGTNNASIFMAVRHTDSTPTSTYANRGDANQLIPIPDVIRNVSISIQVANGTTVSNETVYPMLRPTSIPDSTYEPWYMSNRELTEVQKITFLNDTINGRYINGYKVGRIVNICIKGSWPQNDTYPTLDTAIPDSWKPYESLAVANYSAGMNTGVAFAQIDTSGTIRISNVANLSYYNTTLSYISKG